LFVHIYIIVGQKFKHAKEVIRSCKSKDRYYNGQV